MRNSFKVIILILIGISISGCSLRMSDYNFQKDTGLDECYHNEAAGYIETELHTKKYFDMVNLSWGLGFLRGSSGGKVDYSTENATHYFPHSKDAIDANMLDTRITARVYPLKSIKVFKTGLKLAPYAGLGYGYFKGKVTKNARGAYLGKEIYGGRHYGLTTTELDFSGNFSSSLFGIEIGGNKSDAFFMVEYRQDTDKQDGTVDFDADQVLIGFGAGW